MFQSQQEKGLFTFYREQAQQEDTIKKVRQHQRKAKQQNFGKLSYKPQIKTEVLIERKKIYPLKKTTFQKSILQQISQLQEHKIVKSAREKSQQNQNERDDKKIKLNKLENQTQDKLHRAFFQSKNLQNIKPRKLNKIFNAEDFKNHSMQLSKQQSTQSLPNTERIKSRYTKSDSVQLQSQFPNINSSGNSMGKYLIPKVKIKSNLISKALKQQNTNVIRKMRQELRQQIQREKEYILHHLRLQKFHQNLSKKFQNEETIPDNFIGRHRKLLSILKFKINPK